MGKNRTETAAIKHGYSSEFGISVENKSTSFYLHVTCLPRIKEKNSGFFFTVLGNSAKIKGTLGIMFLCCYISIFIRFLKSCI